MCSALSSVPEDEANKENNEEGCISARHEAKLYLVNAVSKLRLYAQVHFNKLTDEIPYFCMWAVNSNSFKIYLLNIIDINLFHLANKMK